MRGCLPLLASVALSLCAAACTSALSTSRAAYDPSVGAIEPTPPMGDSANGGLPVRPNSGDPSITNQFGGGVGAFSPQNAARGVFGN